MSPASAFHVHSANITYERVNQEVIIREVNISNDESMQTYL